MEVGGDSRSAGAVTRFSALPETPGYANRRSPTKVAPGFDHTRSALGASLVPDGAPKRAMRRTPAKVASVGAVDNRHGLPWG
jgi:hypothetical protein